MEGLDRLNNLTTEKFREGLLACCASERFVEEMLRQRPFSSEAVLEEKAKQVWDGLDNSDLMQAIAAHPRIGGQVARNGPFKSWSKNEQEGVGSAGGSIRHELAKLNDEYFDKFGFIFLICATGKSAQEMLEALRIRLHNNREMEIEIVNVEMWHITKLRMMKLLEELRSD